jgi:hypothetical protein
MVPTCHPCSRSALLPMYPVCTGFLSRTAIIKSYEKPSTDADRLASPTPRRRAAGRRPQAALAAASRPSRASTESARLLPVARHRAREAACSVAPESSLPRGLRREPAQGVRARRVPRLPVLDPARSRASARRSGRQGGTRAGDEVGDDAARARCLPRVRAQRAGAVWALPPACPADTARGAERACLRAVERPQALAQGERSSAAGPARRGLVRRLVRWVEATAADRRAESAGFGCAGSDLAADDWLEAPRPAGAGGGSGRSALTDDRRIPVAAAEPPTV